MSSNPKTATTRKCPPGLFVLLLFLMVLGMFAFFHIPTQKIKNSETSSGMQEEAQAARFMEIMQSGKNLLDQGLNGAEKAAELFAQAVATHGGDLDARLNYANALLLLNQTEEVILQTSQAIDLNPNAAAAHYLRGCAYIREGNFEEAIKSLQIAKQIDHTINAVSYQLGRAHQGLGQWEPATVQFEEVIQFDPLHPSAYYNLSQTYLRLDRGEEAQAMLEKHQEVIANQPLSTDPSVIEKCLYTEAIAPFELEQPDNSGIDVRFVDATKEFLGDLAATLRGPVGLLDIGHDDTLDLLLRDPDQGFQLLVQSPEGFQAAGFPVPALPEARYSQCLIGDLQHQGTMRTGQQEDAILVSDQGMQVFQISPNGLITDSSMFARIADLKAEKARLIDFDITGKLDLLTIESTNRSLLFHRNLGTLSFLPELQSTNLPTGLENVSDFVLEDWDGDDLPDLFVTRAEQPAQLFLKKRGGGMTLSQASSPWPIARTLAVGDLDNDLRHDAVFATASGIEIWFQGKEEPLRLPMEGPVADQIKLMDYDNDGWLDIMGFGEGFLSSWRNTGLEGFVETTEALGLSGAINGTITSMLRGDMDGDCDSDLVLTLADQSIQILRNEGGNTNTMLKIRMEGSRSNPSGLGVKVELTTGGLRMMRTLDEIPLEIGLGKRKKVDSIDPHWTDTITQVDYEIEDCSSLVMFELEMPTGSCPYLYAWDGSGFRFVTDLLGAAPLGLPMAEGKYIPADTDEIVWIGDEAMFPARDGKHWIQITEELREVLYLDEAKLMVVDHPEGTEVHATSKLVPQAPFPETKIRTFKNPMPPIKALRNDGVEMTEALRDVDEIRASPVALQRPQLRGWAEPYSLDMDFGTLDPSCPWALVMTGWLHFGGGMANIGASHDTSLPFPFPTLEIMGPNGNWEPLEVVTGAPAGKTKTMIVDLADRLPYDACRIRCSMAFEIHWDRIQLMEAVDEANTLVHAVSPATSDLHWRGFSRYQEGPWTQPLTPDYDQVRFDPSWLITPSGWCTRYGSVNELLGSKDNQLVLMNGGDECTLGFDTGTLPAKPISAKRDYFLFTSGWDKDADFHVAQGWTVNPIPWHGMDPQSYGQEQRPDDLDDGWMKAYNTRWVGEMTLRKRREP